MLLIFYMALGTAPWQKLIDSVEDGLTAWNHPSGVNDRPVTVSLWGNLPRLPIYFFALFESGLNSPPA